MRRVSVLVLSLTLAGCGALNSHYTPPAVTTAQSWAEGGQGTAVVAPDWWKAFDDPTLDALVAEALKRNNDLAVAAIRVSQARARAGLARDAERPQLGASADASTSRTLSSPRETGRSASVTGSVSWEIDLWNKLGSATDAATFEAAATEEDRQAAALSLVGTVAELYWTIAYLNERVALSEQSIAYAERTLSLIESQVQAGGASELERAEARRSLEVQRASHFSLVQQRIENRNALAVLFDGPPESVKPERLSLPVAAPPEVAAGLPAALLARRPDLRAAELRLRSSLATVDETRLSYYPGFNLTGTLGSSSDALIEVLRNPIATLGIGLTLPFLQWNQMELDIAVARGDYEAAVIDFRQTLYEALSDVENTLAARRNDTGEVAARIRALDAARQAETIYETRYRAGAVALQSWLDAQENRRSAEASLSESRLNLLLDHIALCQALGGNPG